MFKIQTSFCAVGMESHFIQRILIHEIHLKIVHNTNHFEHFDRFMSLYSLLMASGGNVDWQFLKTWDSKKSQVV